MRPVRALVLISSALALSAACTSGQTQVQGLPEVTETSRPTGPTATGPTAATGVTGATGDAFSLVFDIPPAAADFISEAAFFTCDGLEGTWRYIFQADFGSGIALAIDTTVDMEGGDGTMVFGGELSPEGFAGTLTFQDTVELAIRGTPDAPGLVATSVEVSVSGNLEGVPVSVFETFQENDQLPIVPGSDRC